MEVKCWWGTDPLNAVFWRFPNWLRFIITNIITNSARLVSRGQSARQTCSLISHQCTAFPQSLEGKQTQPLIPTIPEDLLLHPTTAPPTSTHSRSQYTWPYFPEGWPLRTHGPLSFRSEGLFKLQLRLPHASWLSLCPPAPPPKCRFSGPQSSQT